MPPVFSVVHLHLRFRMVVLADEILESFFESDFSSTFRLQPVPLELPSSNSGLLGGLWHNITSDDNRKIFNSFTDQIGRTIGKHQVYHRPAIGKYTTLEEPKARESLLTPTMRRSASKNSLNQAAAEGSPKDPSSPSSTSSVSPSSSSQLGAEPSATMTPLTPMPSMFQAAAQAAAYMERTPFAIDDAKDEDEDTEDESGFEDDGVLDEVNCVPVLSFHGRLLMTRRSMLSWKSMIQA